MKYNDLVYVLPRREWVKRMLSKNGKAYRVVTLSDRGVYLKSVKTGKMLYSFNTDSDISDFELLTCDDQ